MIYYSIKIVLKAIYIFSVFNNIYSEKSQKNIVRHLLILIQTGSFQTLTFLKLDKSQILKKRLHSAKGGRLFFDMLYNYCHPIASKDYIIIGTLAAHRGGPQHDYKYEEIFI